MEGKKLNNIELKTLSEEQRTRLYTSLADVHIQLRRLVFPSIGRLHVASASDGGVHVGKKTASIDLNTQQLEGVAPLDIVDSYMDRSGGTLRSANDYTTMLLEIADNAFAKGRGIVKNEEHAQDRLYHLHMFREYAQGWADPDLNDGPFVLVHGDLELFNLILDNEMNIISVLDWEWSRVVPVQFFSPPLWLNSTRFESLCYSFQYRRYLECSLDEFLDDLRARERERYGEELLADEWEKRKQDSGFLVASALEGWTGMDWFANRYINFEVYGGKEDVKERVTKSPRLGCVRGRAERTGSG